MKKLSLFTMVTLICLSLFGCAGSPNISNEDTMNETKTLLNPGEVFEKGKYIEVDGIQILYNGESFLIQNNRTDMVRILCSVVGVKKDGTYDVIQLASLAGVDETQYERDKSENGWAIEQQTNLIRSNETLEAQLEVFDFNTADSNYPKNDIDDDGYMDIVFTISPQIDETTITSSTDDPKSEIYKIKNE